MDFWQTFEIDDEKDIKLCSVVMKNFIIDSNRDKYEKSRIVYLNGKLVPENEARISIFDLPLCLEIWFSK